MCGLEEDFFDIGWDLASESSEQNLGWVGVIDQLRRVLVKEGRQFFQPGPDLCRCNANCLGRACFFTFFFREVDGEGE
jgi:hypothetical protein